MAFLYDEEGEEVDKSWGRLKLATLQIADDQTLVWLTAFPPNPPHTHARLTWLSMHVFCIGRGSKILPDTSGSGFSSLRTGSGILKSNSYILLSPDIYYQGRVEIPQPHTS